MNRQTQLKIVGTVAVVLFVYFILVFFPIHKEFFRDCLNISENDSVSKVTSLLNKYKEDRRFIYTRSNEKGVLYNGVSYDYQINVWTEQLSLTDDYSCNIYFKKDEVVYVESIFD